MSSFLPPAARAFVAQASRIPTSFKDVFLETRQVLGLRAQRARGTKLSRREELLIETNTQSLSYLLAFFLAQVPPVIGWLPVFVALQYPRQLLTSHFHTPEQIDAFLAAEYQERTQLSLELRDYIVRSYAPIHPRLFLAGGPLEQMSALSTQHSRLLAGATALHNGNSLMQRLVPAAVERRMLAAAAISFMRDDGCLQAEGLGDLTTRELQRALVRRGFNPWPSGPPPTPAAPAAAAAAGTVHDAATATAAADALAAAIADEGRVALTSWLQIYDSVTPVAIQGGKVAPPSHSYMLHAACLPELLPELSEWRKRRQDKAGVLHTDNVNIKIP